MRNRLDVAEHDAKEARQALDPGAPAGGRCSEGPGTLGWTQTGVAGRVNLLLILLVLLIVLLFYVNRHGGPP